jgi:CHAT domain-containing protein/Tfp pilus assembly protein PilF
MTESPKAPFLSHASEDAAAARQIRSALRVLAVGLCCFIGSLAIDAVGLAAAESATPSYRDFIPEVERLQRSKDWAGLERLSQDLTIKFRGHPESQDMVMATYWLANAWQGENRHTDAVALYLPLLDSWEKTHGPEDFFAAILCQNLGTVYLNEHDPAQGIPMLQRSIAIMEKSASIHGATLSSTLNELGDVYLEEERYDQAEPLFREALELRKKLSDVKALGQSYNALAVTFEREYRYAEAEPLLQSAVELVHNVFGDNCDYSRAISNLGAVYEHQLLYARAEPLYKKALAICEQAKPPLPAEVAQNLNNLAVLYTSEGHSDQAEPLYQQALDLWNQSDQRDRVEHAEVLRNVAEFYRNKGQLDKAQDLVQQALEIWQKRMGPDNPEVAWASARLGSYLIGQRKYAQAEPLYRRALAIDEHSLGGEHPITIAMREGLAANEVLLGHYDEAVRGYRTACTFRSEVLSSSDRLGQVLWGVENSAENCFRGYANALRGWWSRGGGSGASDRPDALKSEAFLAVQQSMMSMAGVALARSAALTAANATQVGPEARAYEIALSERERLDGAYAGAVANGQSEQLQQVSKARNDADARARQLEAALKTRAPRYWDYRAPAPLSIKQLQALNGSDASLLRKNEALIVILAPPKGSGLVFAVSKEKSAWAEIVDMEQVLWNVFILRMEIDPEAYGVRDMVIGKRTGPNQFKIIDKSTAGADIPGMPRAHFEREKAYQVYQSLLGDPAIQEVIRDKSVLLFVSSGALIPLPPALLVTAQPPGGVERDADADALRATSWLLRSKATALLPTVSSLRTMRQVLPAAHREANEPLLAFADPVFAPTDAEPSKPAVAGPPRALQSYYRNGIPIAEALNSLPPLPGTRMEVEALRRVLNAPRSSVLLGRDASKAQLMARNADGRLAQVRVLEFATHGLIAGDVTGLAEPGLVLAAGSRPEDSLLRASEASSLRLGAEWVLLSACNTASPSATQAQGLSGLASAFLYAGARSLLVSHWQVRDDVAALLIPSILQAQQRDPHLSRAEAVRKASLAILDDAHLHAADPAAWAPFTLIGEPGRE